MVTCLPYWVLFHGKDIFYNICSSAVWVLLSLTLLAILCEQPGGKKAKAEVCHFSSETIASWNIMVLSLGNSVFPYIKMTIINSLMSLPPFLLCNARLVLCDIPQGCFSRLLDGARQTQQAAAPFCEWSWSLSIKGVAIEVQHVLCSPFLGILNV